MMAFQVQVQVQVQVVRPPCESKALNFEVAEFVPVLQVFNMYRALVLFRAGTQYYPQLLTQSQTRAATLHWFPTYCKPDAQPSSTTEKVEALA